MQETWVWSLILEDTTCCRATKPEHHSYWACALEPGSKYWTHVLQLRKPTHPRTLQSCPTLCHPMDCSMPGLSVYHQLPEFTQTHVHQVNNAIQPSHPLSLPFFSRLQSFPTSGSFQMNQLFTSGGQSIGVSASTSVLQHQSFQWTLRTDLL